LATPNHRLWRSGIALALLAALVLSGCAAPGAAPEPTTRPQRLMEPTAGAQRQPTGAATAPAASTGQPSPTQRPAPSVTFAGIIDELDDQGLRVNGTLVVLDPATRLTGTPERGAWVQVRGDDDDGDDRIVAREVTVVTTTAQVVGPLEAVNGDLWTIDGVTVRVPAALQPIGLVPGGAVRAVVRLGDDDDDRWYEALLVEPARALTLIGQLTLIDAGGIVVDGRRFALAPGVTLPSDLTVGSVVRVRGDDDDDDGSYTLRGVERAADARLLGGVVQRVGAGVIVVGGQELRLAPGVVLLGTAPAVGRPVQLIVEVRNSVLTVVNITIVNLVVVAPQNLVPAPRPVAPARPAAPVVRPSGGGSNNSSNNSSNNRSNDDDDDDDDDD
jgi:hypothetical protein